jgi:predicted nucleotidyltransferase
MTNQTIQKTLISSRYKKLLQNYAIKHLRLAGSFAHQTNTNDSDIDLVYELDNTKQHNGRGIFSVIPLLESEFHRPVDMINTEFMDDEVRKTIYPTMQQLW